MHLRHFSKIVRSYFVSHKNVFKADTAERRRKEEKRESVCVWVCWCAWLRACVRARVCVCVWLSRLNLRDPKHVQEVNPQKYEFQMSSSVILCQLKELRESSLENVLGQKILIQKTLDFLLVDS